MKNLLNYKVCKQYQGLKISHAKISNENFEKFKVIVELENKEKLKAHKFEEIETEKRNLEKVVIVLENRIQELEVSVVTSKTIYERQTKDLKKEFDKMVKFNETLKKDSSGIEEQLKVYISWSNNTRNTNK